MEITVNMQFLFIFMLTVSCTLSVIAVTCGIMALIKVIAMEKSTHTMQYISPDEVIKEYTQEENTANWATNSKTIEEQNKLYQEELKDLGMADFVPEDEDKKIYSF